MKQREFPVHYRQLALPQLGRVAHAFGLQVGYDECSFADAHSIVWRRAMTLGSGFLSDHLLEELEDWICSRITDAAVQASEWR